MSRSTVEVRAPALFFLMAISRRILSRVAKWPRVVREGIVLVLPICLLHSTQTLKRAGEPARRFVHLFLYFFSIQNRKGIYRKLAEHLDVRQSAPSVSVGAPKKTQGN